MVQSFLEAAFAEATTLQIIVQGRKSGRERGARVWFAYKAGRVYLLAHREVQWWRNLQANPRIKLQLDNQTIEGRAKIVPEMQELVYKMFREKYGSSEVDYWYGNASSNRLPLEVEILR